MRNGWRTSTTRAAEQGGFTLVELLVLLVIIGLLAAIAIPAFFSQRDKARDSSAKTYARTAETAMETFATDNGGVYTGANRATLIGEEQTLIGSTMADADIVAPAGGGDTTNKSYKVTVHSSTGNTFTVTRHDNGTTSLSCTTGGDAGCPTGGTSW